MILGFLFGVIVAISIVVVNDRSEAMHMCITMFGDTIFKTFICSG